MLMLYVIGRKAARNRRTWEMYDPIAIYVALHVLRLALSTYRNT